MKDIVLAAALYKAGNSLQYVAKVTHASKVTLLRELPKIGIHIRSKSETNLLRVTLGHYQPKSGLSHPQYKGGSSHRADGYILIKVPGHHRASGPNDYVYEHIIVVERKLGRRLTPDETIHHKNHNRSDNTPSNLEIMTRSKHGHLHSQERWTKNRVETKVL